MNIFKNNQLVCGVLSNSVGSVLSCNQWRALCLLLLLTACSTEKTPFSVDELRGLAPVEVAALRYMKASDEIDLAYRLYAPERPRAVLIFWHGASGHSGVNYPRIGVGLRDRYEIAVITPDRRGHGASSGARGDAPSQEQVFEDVATFVRAARALFPGVPVFLGGHSAGAGLLINYTSYRHAEAVSGLLLLAPKLGFSSQTARKMARPFVRQVKRELFADYANTGNSGNEYAVFFDVSEETRRRFPKFVTAITVNMANATTPMSPGYQLRRIDTPAVVWIGDQDEAFEPWKLIHFVNENNPSIETHVIPNETHLSIAARRADLLGEWITKRLK